MRAESALSLYVTWLHQVEIGLTLFDLMHWLKLYFHGPPPIFGQLCFPDCAGTILLDFLPKSSSSFKAFKRPLSKTFLLKQEPLEKWTEHSILFISLLGGLEKNYVSKTHCILIEFYKNNWVYFCYGHLIKNYNQWITPFISPDVLA